MLYDHKWLPWKFYKYKCFEKFMDNRHVVEETTLTDGKKLLVLFHPYLGSVD